MLHSLLRRLADATRAATQLQVQAPPPRERVLMRFRHGEYRDKWRTTSDAVYGGGSSAHLTPDGTCFHGDLSTKIMTPESSANAALRSGYAAMLLREPFNLDDFDTLVLRCRAPPRSSLTTAATSAVANDDDNESGGAGGAGGGAGGGGGSDQGGKSLSDERATTEAPAQRKRRHWLFNVTTESHVAERALYQMPFVAPEASFGEVPLPLSKFVMTFRGSIVDVASEMNKRRVLALGITLADGIDGPFALELDHLRAVRDA